MVVRGMDLRRQEDEDVYKYLTEVHMEKSWRILCSCMCFSKPENE
jgi:hypothetical protein